MKLCRYNDNRLGVIQAEKIIDISVVLDDLPVIRWSQITADPVIAHLPEIIKTAPELIKRGEQLPLADVQLLSPVAMPTKIIGAPVNYHAHIEESLADNEINRGRSFHKIDDAGCFLKANSALCGNNSDIPIPFVDERIDYEAEVAIIIGKPAYKVKVADAMQYVAAYSLALDMTVRGTQDRSMRKSCNGFAVLGPWLVTADEIPHHNDISFSLAVDGEERQSANTSLLIRSIPELIEMCSAYYTLNAGDIIMTGTPAGVSAVAPGNKITVHSTLLGILTVNIV